MSLENDQYEQLGPSKSLLNAPPPPPPPPVGGSQEPKQLKQTVLPARTPGQTTLGQFALRPGDDVDLSSEHGTVIGSAEGKKSKEATDIGSGEKDKDKDKEKEKEKEKEKTKARPIQIEIKPYVEPTMLKICHTITLALLLISFVLMALTVMQFIDLFVWLPVLFGDDD